MKSEIATYLFPCHGNICGIQIVSPFHPESWHPMQSCECRMVSCNSYPNWQIDVIAIQSRERLEASICGKEDEMCALVCEPCVECYRCYALSQRFILVCNRHKVADKQEARRFAGGAVAYAKIFITGIVHQNSWPFTAVREYEVFNETTNEWQFITGFNIDSGSILKLTSVNVKLYAYGIKTLS